MLAYFRLLVRDRIAAWNPKSYQKAGSSALKTWLMVGGYALLALFLYAMVGFLEYGIFIGAKQVGEPEAALTLVFMLNVFLTLFMSFFYVLSALFFSRDIPMVSALPISSRTLLGAKLLMIVLREGVIALLINLPMMIFYGLEVGAGIGLYLKVILYSLFIPVLPIAVVTLLSFLLIRLSALWKRREMLTIVVSFVLLLGFIAAEMSFFAFVDEDEMGRVVMQLFMQQKVIVDMLSGMYPPLMWLNNAIVMSGAQSLLHGLLFIAVNAGAMALVIWLAGASYQRLAVRQSEVLARLNAQGKRGKKREHTRSPFMALYVREMKEVITVPTYAMNGISQTVMFPLIAVIMIFSMQKQLDGANLASFLLPLVPSAMFFGIAAAALCFSVSMNLAVSTAVSREGKRYYMARLFPVKPSTQLNAKLAMGLTYNTLGIVFMAAVFWAVLPVFWVETLLAVVFANLFSLFSAAAGLLMDAYRPRLQWKNEAEAMKQNGNGMLSMLVSVVGVAALVGIYFGGTALGLSMEMAYLPVFLVMIAADVLLVRWLQNKGASTYYLQERSI